jgi:uncharacterized phage-associated protein
MGNLAEVVDSNKTEAMLLAEYIKWKYLQYDKNVNQREVSPIKLQKSLYFLFAYWGQYIRQNKENKDSVEVDYSEYNEILFDDKIEAWTYGPVVPQVYMADKCGLLNDIPREGYLEKNIVKKEFIDNLLEQLFEIDDFGLVSISHQDECWKKNYIKSDERHNKEIPKEEIIDEYSKR